MRLQIGERPKWPVAPQQTKPRHLRTAYGFDLHGYVLMPEHVHLLLSEPTHYPLATTLKILKQQTSKLLGNGHPFWLPRYHDFNVRTEAKRLEKLRYIHHNPVKRSLASRPEDYPWSSAHHSTGTTPGAPFMTASPS